MNVRGLRLFTQSWVPATPPKALVIMFHGYSGHMNWNMVKVIHKFVEHGYAVHCMDFEGHGKSDGLHCYIPDIQNIVHDCINHFTAVKATYPGLKCFFAGLSFGGAIALECTLNTPGIADGCVLLAPMCKIADELKPSPAVIAVLRLFECVCPMLPLTPTRFQNDKIYRDHDVREFVERDPYHYPAKPRFRTANQLLKFSLSLENRLPQVDVPFLVMHGQDDVITSPEVSRKLYESAASVDKTLRIYEGMWHDLLHYTQGPSPNSNDVYNDIFTWLDARATLKEV